MVGREDKKQNDLFYLCSLIEYMARKTKNRPGTITEKLGQKNLQKIYDLADVYHSDNIADVSDSFIRECHIENGNFDNISGCMYAVPTHWDMGKVYRRLILRIAGQDGTDIISALEKLFASSFADKMENYNSDLYYQNADCLYQFYTEGITDAN